MTQPPNPILDNRGADPWLFSFQGQYFLTYTSGDRVELVAAPTLEGLRRATPTVLWWGHQGPSAYSQNLWAPELHRLDGVWYLYVTANDGSPNDPPRHHRGDDRRQVCVLSNPSADPRQGTWAWRGPLGHQRSGLDGTVLSHRGRLYFCYSGYGEFALYGSGLYLAPMTNPTALSGPEVLVSAPTEPWECQGGMAINEGPCFLVRGGKVHLTFSASTTWSPHYCLGRLWCPDGADLLDSAAWTKLPGPIFSQNPEAEIFAPGHHSFFQTLEGDQTWIAYHALPAPQAPLSLRRPRVQPIGFNADGDPELGRPR